MQSFVLSYHHWLYCEGKGDINSVGNYIQWNGLTKIAGWNSEDARRIYGSECKRFQPRLKKEDTPVLFVEQLYR